MRTTPKATTMQRCIREAREFIRLAEEVPLSDFGKDFKGKKVQSIESGKVVMTARNLYMYRAL